MTEDGKKSLGAFLKSERERRGFTIEQTSSATKIGLKILRQLEADQYVDLPALPFVRGFVRNYGKFLGLDGEKILAEYSSFLEAHASERPKRDAGHSGYAFERPEGEQSRKVLWGVMAGMLVFGGAVVFLFKPALKRKHHGHVEKLKPGGVESEVSGEMPNPNPTLAPVSSASPMAAPSHVPEAPFVAPKVPLVLAPPKPSPAPEPSPSAGVPSAVPSPIATATPVASVSPSPEDDLVKDPLQSGTNYASRDIHHKLIIRTKADVVVRYRCDEKKLMRFSLKKDKILVLRGKGSVFFQVSNPDSITLQVSGQGETLFSQYPSAFQFQGNLTAAFPNQQREKIDEKFKITAPLPTTEGPAPTP